jgi:MscS family membrane protein
MKAEQMEKGIEVLKEIATNNSDVNDDYMVSFNAFGDFSLGIIFIYYIKSGRDNLAVQTAINLAILKQFGEHGLDMAFPTQTIYNITEKN